MFQRLAAIAYLIVPSLALAHGGPTPGSTWIAVKAPTKIERSRLANEIAIDTVVDDTAYAFVSPEELKVVKSKKFKIEKSLPGTMFLRAGDAERDFPARDEAFHNYMELTTEIDRIATTYGRFVTKFSIGRSLEGKEIWGLRFNPDGLGDGEVSTLPGIVFIGGHHAREHLSVETALNLAKHLAQNNGTDTTVTELLRTREVFIIPQLNIDGSEWDIASGSYRMWRKNRRPPATGNCAGVDLNRNYGHMWGTGGSSTNPCSDVFMGPQPFSEPETIAVKNFVESKPNLKILLSFHTYSELILYPWGHKYDPISNADHLRAYETMARTMAQWNGYTPQQSSDLYIASGDTTDWSYGALGIFSFTFELSPSQFGGGGFYPGAAAIEPTFRANLRPALYLIDLADDPLRSARAPQTTLFFGR